MMNIRDNVSLPKDKKKIYKLISLEDTSKYLSSAYLCVKDFFKILRSSPELMYKIIFALMILSSFSFGCVCASAIQQAYKSLETQITSKLQIHQKRKLQQTNY